MPLPPLNIHLDRVVVAWLVSGLLCIIVPLITMGSARASNRRQQENDGDGDNNQDNNNDGENDNEYYCRWWQWGCSRYNNGEDDRNGDGEEERTTPWWWFFSTDEERRRRDEENGRNPSLTFVYVWSLILFCCILYFGYRQVKNGSDLYRVVSVLVMYANFCFLSMILLGGLEGGVQTEGRELEEQGFYAQFAVMMFITNLFSMVFSIVFAFLFHVKARRSGIEKIIVDESDYRHHTHHQYNEEPSSKHHCTVVESNYCAMEQADGYCNMQTREDQLHEPPEVHVTTAQLQKQQQQQVRQHQPPQHELVGGDESPRGRSFTKVVRGIKKKLSKSGSQGKLSSDGPDIV